MADSQPLRRSIGRLTGLYARVLANASRPADGTICAFPIPNSPASRLGRDSGGLACLVISTPPSPGAARPDIRLQYLRVQRRVQCEVTRPDGERENLTGALVTCYADTGDLRGFFLDLFDQALDALGPAPSERDIDAWIDHAARLFSELEEPAVSEVRGLWGELFVIAEAHSPTTLVRRWHEDSTDRHDFLAGAFALEVKTCRDHERVHTFSLPQVRPGAGMEVVIASVPVRADPQGLSVMDLLSELEGRLPDDAVRMKLRETAFRSGGAAMAHGNPQRFDRRTAREGLRFMWASEIPAIEESPPAEVLEVTLKVRCRDVPGEDLSHLVEARLGAA